MTTPAQLKRFVGNPNVYAVQREDGTWYPVREPLTIAVLAKHLRRELTVGTYLVDGEDARWLVFDVDADAVEDALVRVHAIAEVLDELDLRFAIEFSGKKGYHVWVGCEKFVPAAILQRLGRGIRDELGFTGMEVFPKQTKTRDLGNLVKLPGGVHQVTGQPNNFITSFPSFNTVTDIELAAAKYPEVLASRGVGTPAAIEYPCVCSIQDGVEEGGRNIHLYHLAAMLRKFSLSDDAVEYVVRRANEKSSPPLEEQELSALLDSSRHSGPICDQLSADYHCGEQCVKARHPGLYTRAGALKYAADGEHAVVVVKHSEGLSVELEHPDINQARAVLYEPRKPRGR